MKDRLNLRIVLCWLGVHLDIGITAGHYIRCYTCGKDHMPKFAWRKTGWITHEEMLEYRKEIGVN